MEQEQKQRHDNIIDRLNNAYNSYQTFRSLGRLGRSGVGIARGAAPLFANPYVLVGVLVVVIIIVFIIVLTGGPGGTGSQTGGTPPPGTIGNISSCQFTRDGQGVPLKSQKIADMFSEISLLSSVPTAVLASVARHENPGYFQAAYDNLPSVQKNFYDVRNASGDLGFMQVNITHPLNIEPNTLAAKRAAQKLGKQFNGLGYCRPSVDVADDVNLDFCNIRDNIAIAAEILNNKLGNGSWQNLADLERASCWYHNINCKYPNKDAGPYNYGEEVRRDYENCQQNQTVFVGGGGPIPVPNIQTLRADIKNQFAVEFASDFSSRVLTWAWEALWTAQQRGPNFFSLLSARYSVVNIKAGATITNTSGDTITIKNTANGPLYSEQYFKQVFIHELGHVIYGQRDSPNPTFRNRINEAIIKDSGTITAYAEKSTANPNLICGTPDASTKVSEDFADSVSYYININQEELTYGCGIKNPGKNPFQTGKYPNHLLFIENLLRGINF